RCRISLVEPTRASANACLDVVLNWVADFEAKYSRFLEHSLINRINAAAGRHWVEVDEETDRLLALCGGLWVFTRGAFDPTALPLVRLWNWKTAAVPGEEDLAQARALVGWRHVQRRAGSVFLPRPGMCLDFGGLGKEYAVDRVLGLATAHGVKH